MKQIWAPWRAEYIHGQKPGHCIFCKPPHQNFWCGGKEYSKDGKNELVLYRGDFAAVMMNKFPYNNGHLLVYPWRHTNSLENSDKEEALELFKLIKWSVAMLKKEMKPGGFNIGINLGKDAGAGIEDHIHFHIVPRWNGDTNFMPAIGEVRVMSEHLQATYNKLYPHFQKNE